jgi:hypothetical protein
MNRPRPRKQHPEGFSWLRSGAARALFVACICLVGGGLASAWIDVPTSCASLGRPGATPLGPSGAAGTEAPAWTDVRRSISAARSAGESNSIAAPKGTSDRVGSAGAPR